MNADEVRFWNEHLALPEVSAADLNAHIHREESKTFVTRVSRIMQGADYLNRTGMTIRPERRNLPFARFGF